MANVDGTTMNTDELQSQTITVADEAGSGISANNEQLPEDDAINDIEASGDLQGDADDSSINTGSADDSSTIDEQWSENYGDLGSYRVATKPGSAQRPAVMKRRRCILLTCAIIFVCIGILAIYLRSTGVSTTDTTGRFSRTVTPTAALSGNPTNSPTRAPTQSPTNNPTAAPTESPTTSSPTLSPTAHPTVSPTTAAPTAPKIVTVVGSEDKEGRKIKVPSDTMPGDLMVLLVGGGCKKEPSGISPGDWTKIDDKGSSDLSVSAYYMPFVSNSTYEYQFKKGECVMTAMVSLRGVDLASPVVDEDVDFETRGGLKGDSRAPKVKTEEGGLVLAAFSYDDGHAAKVKTKGFDTLVSFRTGSGISGNGFAVAVSSEPTEDGEAGPIDASSGKTAQGMGEEVAMSISFRRAQYTTIVQPHEIEDIKLLEEDGDNEGEEDQVDNDNENN